VQHECSGRVSKYKHTMKHECSVSFLKCSMDAVGVC
jgi:hypothetical protein